MSASSAAIYPHSLSLPPPAPSLLIPTRPPSHNPVPPPPVPKRPSLMEQAQLAIVPRATVAFASEPSSSPPQSARAAPPPPSRRADDSNEEPQEEQEGEPPPASFMTAAAASPLRTIHRPLPLLLSPLRTIHRPLPLLLSPLRTIHRPLPLLLSPLRTIHRPLPLLLSSPHPLFPTSPQARAVKEDDRPQWARSRWCSRGVSPQGQSPHPTPLVRLFQPPQVDEAHPLPAFFVVTAHDTLLPFPLLHLPSSSPSFFFTFLPQPPLPTAAPSGRGSAGAAIIRHGWKEHPSPRRRLFPLSHPPISTPLPRLSLTPPHQPSLLPAAPSGRRSASVYERRLSGSTRHSSKHHCTLSYRHSSHFLPSFHLPSRLKWTRISWYRRPWWWQQRTASPRRLRHHSHLSPLSPSLAPPASSGRGSAASHTVTSPRIPPRPFAPAQPPEVDEEQLVPASFVVAAEDTRLDAAALQLFQRAARTAGRAGRSKNKIYSEERGRYVKALLPKGKVRAAQGQGALLLGGFWWGGAAGRGDSVKRKVELVWVARRRFVKARARAMQGV
ncbi:unnamed protein product [Closterium sp. NIES-65]|nr:unnamed protein product [Closterium sp. NIES-65]